jgi:CheY-like chemotaxis protein
MPDRDTKGFADSRVLVVDDNEQNLELIQAYLETLGCRIDTARNGLEALRRVAETRPDLILLDVMMPKMSGFEVCRKLKGDDRTRDIPVIMVTALNELGDIERGVECGTDDFLSKPVNKLELLTRVKSLLRVRHLRDELDRTLAYLNDMERRPGSDEPDPAGDRNGNPNVNGVSGTGTGTGRPEDK